MIDDAAFWHRIQFAFTIVYHYLFPQLTMGLAWFLVAWKWLHLRTGDARYGDAARLWTRIFGINFAVGVVTGIPMEFQFGTNWASFSKYAGGVIGQSLAMEGMFSFFFESAFIGAMVWGEKRLGPRNPLPRDAGRGSGELAFRLFHPGDQRIHAIAARIRVRRGRIAAPGKFKRLSAEPLGADRVLPQPVCGDCDGLVRHRRRGSVLRLARRQRTSRAACSSSGARRWDWWPR